jgi:hypothetical protein
MDAWMRYGNGTKLIGELFAKSNIVTIPCGLKFRHSRLPAAAAGIPGPKNFSKMQKRLDMAKES